MGGGEHMKEQQLSLKDSIGAILNGTAKEREIFKGRFFHMADTPAFMKELGLSGGHFSVRYGVISRHRGKDEGHDLTEQNWIDLCDAITKPFAIARYGNEYRIFTTVKIGARHVAVGVDVKNIGMGIKVNAVSRACLKNRVNDH